MISAVNNYRNNNHRDPLSWTMVLKVLVLIGAALCTAELLHSHAISNYLRATQGVQLEKGSSDATKQANGISEERPSRVSEEPVQQEEKEEEKANEVEEIKRDPKIHFITYGDDHYTNSKARIVQEARSSNWFETVQAFGPSDLPKSFTDKFFEILREGRGGGYWTWKFALLEEALARVPKGDIVTYLDAGCQVNRNGEKRFWEYVQMIQDSPSYDVLGFQMPHPEHEWTTDKIFQAFEVEPSSDIRRSGQMVGGILMVRNGPHARKWLDLVWQVLEKDQWLASDRYNEEAKAVDPAFHDNRHDQSISSVSRKLVGSIHMPDETFPPDLPDMPFHASRIHGRF